ncbi:MAG TPA: DUF167 domain-containing protein [Candidatus Saccharimonadales bacterium]|nr:DUF167 domain-containing protein [Candidatus Saccharimonadales bacterium]
MTAPDVRFAVRLTPRTAADHVDGVVDGVLRVRVGAPAVGGSANIALIRLLADELDIPRTSIRIVAGATSRAKLLVVDGVSAEDLSARWPGLRV